MYSDLRKRKHARFSVGNVVFVSRLPVHTGLPTKLQRKFRGPMVITQILPNDSYQLLALSGTNNYSCTAHSSQLKWYQPHEVDPGEMEEFDETETATQPEPVVEISSDSEQMEWAELSTQQPVENPGGSFREPKQQISSTEESSHTEDQSSSSESGPSEQGMSPQSSMNTALLEPPQDSSEESPQKEEETPVRRQQPIRAS